MPQQLRYNLNKTTCSECGKELSTVRGLRQHSAKVHGNNLPNRICKHCGEPFYDDRSDRSTCLEHREYSKYKRKPEDVDMSLSEWFSLTGNQRYHILNRESERKRIRENKEKRTKWVNETFKESSICERCGLEESQIIEFHHTENNQLSESPLQMARNMRSKEVIRGEIMCGEFLCPNCHAREHRKI